MLTRATSGLPAHLALLMGCCLRQRPAVERDIHCQVAPPDDHMICDGSGAGEGMRRALATGDSACRGWPVISTVLGCGGGTCTAYDVPFMQLRSSPSQIAACVSAWQHHIGIMASRTCNDIMSVVGTAADL